MKNLEIRSQKLEMGRQLKAENQRLLIGNQGIKKILFFILLLWGLGGFAQQYPVQISSYFIPPNNTRISDYATSTEDKYIVQFLDTDIQDFNRKVRLKLTIKGNGITAQSTNFVQNAPDFYLNGGQPLRLSNIDLRAYFELDNLQGLSPQQYAQPLPDGVYQFCWEVFDFNTNAKLSSQSCQPVYLVLNDPPFLNIPSRNENIVARDPTNIVFTWTPRHLNATNVSYEFQLRELWDDGIDPQAAFLASPDLWTEETPSTSLLYDMGKPGLISGKKYGWRVRAKSISGISENAVFKNNGYSEIYWFKYATDCAAPSFVLSEAQSPTRVKITWQSAAAQNKFHIQYRRKKDNLPIAENETKKEKRKRERADATVYEWFEEFTQNTQLQITNLEEGATYEFRVGATCDPLTNFSQSYTYSGIQEFTMPAKSVKTAGYNCGVAPQITIANKTPLPNLGKNEVFTAGDFEITVLERTGTNGIFSGKGYMIVPYLADTKIAVEFNNIKINSSYQMYDGFVFTTYDKTWGNVVSVDSVIDPLITAVGNLCDKLSDLLKKKEDGTISNDEFVKQWKEAFVEAKDTHEKYKELLNQADLSDDLKEKAKNIEPIFQDMASNDFLTTGNANKENVDKIKAFNSETGTFISENCKDSDNDKIVLQELDEYKIYSTPTGDAIILKNASNLDFESIYPNEKYPDLKVPKGALVAFTAYQGSFRASYQKINGKWQFIGYFDKDKKEYFDIDTNNLKDYFAAKIEKEGVNTANCPLVLGALAEKGLLTRTLLSLGIEESAIASGTFFRAVGTTVVLGYLLIKLFGSGTAVTYHYGAVLDLPASATILTDNIGEGYVTVPPISIPIAIPHALPKDEAGNKGCQVYCIYKMLKSTGELTVAKYGMTCQDNFKSTGNQDCNPRPEYQTSSFNKTDLEFAFYYTWITPFEVSKSTAYIVERSMTANFIRNNNGKLPSHHFRPCFVQGDTFEKEQERITKAVKWIADQVLKYGK